MTDQIIHGENTTIEIEEEKMNLKLEEKRPLDKARKKICMKFAWHLHTNAPVETRWKTHQRSPEWRQQQPISIKMEINFQDVEEKLYRNKRRASFWKMTPAWYRLTPLIIDDTLHIFLFLFNGIPISRC